MKFCRSLSLGTSSLSSPAQPSEEMFEVFAQRLAQFGPR